MTWDNNDPNTWGLADPRLDAIPAESRIPWGLAVVDEWDRSSALFDYTRLARWQVADAFVSNEWTPAIRHRLQQILGAHEIEQAQQRRWEKPEAETCDRCRFASNLSVGLARCRRFPPQLARLHTTGEPDTIGWLWPEVDADLGCGEFKARPVGAAV